MNHPARTFHRLMAAWHQDAGQEAIDVLAADMAACIAASGGLACVGLVRSDAVRRLFGLACFLDGYGLTLRQRYIKDRACALVYAEVQASRPESEYAGAVVSERARHPELERVAA
ncbi:MAG: hypothetical protein M3498_05465 [Deinococcota bacterium]|jgi:hypothetical protein|nr:hypothetical protein [Deinococcota bacterium]